MLSNYGWAALTLSGLVTSFFLPGLLAGEYYSASGLLQLFEVFAFDAEFVRQSIAYDSMEQFEPWITFATKSLNNGFLPYWNPYQAGGVPLIANMQSAVFYPPNIGVFVFGPRVGNAVAFGLELFFLGYATYAYLRSMSIEHFPATIVMIAATFSGFAIHWLYWPHGNALFAVPLGLLAINKLTRTIDGRWVALLSIACAIPILGGFPGTAVQIGLLFVVYGTYRLLACEKSLTKKIELVTWFGVSALCGVGVSAIQSVPFLELLGQSNYWESRLAINNLLSIRDLVLIAAPDLYGNYSFNNMMYIENRAYPERTGSYVGLTMLFFAFVAVRFSYPKKEVLFWLLSVTVSILIVYDIGGVGSLVHKLGFLATTNLHRLQWLIGFGLLVLGGFGLSYWMQEKVSPTLIMRWFSSLLVLGLLIAAADVYQETAYEDSYLKYATALGILIAGNLVLLWALLLLRSRSLRVTGLLLCTIVLVETFGRGINYPDRVAENIYYPTTPVLSHLQGIAGINRVAALGGGKGSNISVPCNVLSNYGLYGVTDYSVVRERHMNRVMGKYIDSHCLKGIRQVDSLFLSIMGVKYLITSPAGEGLQTITGYKKDQYRRIWSSENIAIFQNLNALPRSFMVPDSLWKTPSNWTPRSINTCGITETTKYEPNNIIIEAHSSDTCTLVLSDNYYPGWTALKNKENVPILRHPEFNIRGIKLNAGQHTVEFRYASKINQSAVVISFIMLIVVVGLFLAGHIHRRGHQ